MSKSLKRVRAALEEAGLAPRILEMTTETRTAMQAAEAAGCSLDQIAKSIIFRGEVTGHVVLFLTAGGNRVDPDKASAVAGQPLGKADAGQIRAETGFAIGGVAPLGHLSPITCYFDARLLDFDVVWAAAGTPRHIFAVDPRTLLTITGGQPADFIQNPNSM
ncbi:MAG: YbaK/EbsC family protein [Albidovulum sp.]|uniref:YbaK/EbsC family protein n=1 Tax=Albidovulum sp. TaxID=1872424 RepID=UPI003C8209B8